MYTSHLLTHWGRDKMAAVFKLIFLKKINKFWLTFPRSFSQVYNSQQFSIGSDNGLAPIGWQGIIWTNDAYFTDAYMRRTASMSQYWQQPVLIFSFRSYCTNCFYTWRPRQNGCHSKTSFSEHILCRLWYFNQIFADICPQVCTS